MHIAGELTIYTAAEMHAAITAVLKRSRRIEAVDLSAVTGIDTAGLQILLLIRRTLGALERQMRVLNPSPAVSELFELLQLQKQLPVGTD